MYIHRSSTSVGSGRGLCTYIVLVPVLVVDVVYVHTSF